MKRLLFPFLLVLQVACSGINPATPTERIVEGQTSNAATPTPTNTLPLPTDTPIPTIAQTPPLTTATSTPTAADTQNPSPVPCDPIKSYCIEDGHFYLDRPIALPGTITIDPGYPYGSTQGGARDPHHGVEFYNASGTTVLAAADGQVVVAGDDSQQIYAIQPDSYGNLIVIEHYFPDIPEPVYTLYGHLSQVEVQAGQAVHSGEEIGKVGASGAAIGSHLHFEVRLGQNNYDSNRNPVLWLKPLLYGAGNSLGVLAGRVEDTQGNLIQTSGLNIQYFADPNGAQTSARQVETYAIAEHPVQADDAWNENFTLGDLQPGDYRISLIRNGGLYERWVQVLPGKLTFFVLQVDQ